MNDANGGEVNALAGVVATDAACHTRPETCKRRLGAAREALKPEPDLGFNGNHNLAMGVANSLAAVEVGANRIDAAAAGLRTRSKSRGPLGPPSRDERASGSAEASYAPLRRVRECYAMRALGNA